MRFEVHAFLGGMWVKPEVEERLKSIPVLHEAVRQDAERFARGHARIAAGLRAGPPTRSSLILPEEGFRLSLEEEKAFLLNQKARNQRRLRARVRARELRRHDAMASANAPAVPIVDARIALAPAVSPAPDSLSGAAGPGPDFMVAVRDIAKAS